VKKKFMIVALSCVFAVSSLFSIAGPGEELTEVIEVTAENAETDQSAEDLTEEISESVVDTEEMTELSEEGQILLPDLSQPGLTLDKVVILSRHNIRSPLTGEGSMVDEITPHEWFAWTSNTGELSLRGAMLETTMGQYFRLWLEKEGLFPENYIPQDGAVRFYANGLQRTQATAHYFSTGLLPVAVVPVERHVEYDGKDPVFLPLINFMNEAYEADVLEEISERGGEGGLNGYKASMDDSLRLIAEVTDMEESEVYQSGKYGNFFEDDTTVTFEVGKETKVTGPINSATSIADALVLQYYEEADEQKAAFGHELTIDDWKTIGKVLGVNEKIRFEAPLLAVNLAHPMLEELYWEMNAQGRKFSFLCGHDSTIASVLSALGVDPYTLPGAIEPSTPIGVKLVFSRWLDEKGGAFYAVNLVYQSTDQLRQVEPLSLTVPPMIVPISFAETPSDEAGLIAEEDLLELFEEKIGAYDTIVEQYGAQEMDEAA